VRARVREDLAALGPWKREEISLALLLITLLVLWNVLKDSATLVALLGVVLIVLGGMRTWKNFAGAWHAWDALIWLGGFVALAETLKASGFTDWLAQSMRSRFTGWEPVAAAIALALIYFASMYFFSQLTAHIAALAATFCAVAAGVGSPPLLAAALIAYFGCLCGATTPWSTGPVIIYFSLGYVPIGRWMRNGLSLAVFQIALWLGVGMLWWRLLGWW
jgi:DASS family divalent anion:Na+ symporter